MRFNILIYFFLPALIFSCGNSDQAQVNQTSDDTHAHVQAPSSSNVISITNSDQSIPYHLEESLLTMNLPLVLLEISGLSYYPKTNQLLAVNDERGWIFFLNPTTGEIEKKETFSGNGDYEGIEWTGEKISVVKNNGSVYFYDMETKEKFPAFKTDLRPSNDVEGLGIDEANNQLLLACKGNPNIGKSDKYKKVKNIYSFSLQDNKLNPEPFLSVEDDTLEDFVENFADPSLSKKKKKKLKKRVNDFSPSGIAIHPSSKNFYLISSQGKLLLVFNHNKELQQVIFLDEKKHRQPEGICFAPNGDLFISNEGKGLGAKIMKYNMH